MEPVDNVTPAVTLAAAASGPMSSSSSSSSEASQVKTLILQLYDISCLSGTRGRGKSYQSLVKTVGKGTDNLFRVAPKTFPTS